MRDMTIEESEEIRECHPESRVECYCNNTHEQNNTTCLYCLIHKRMDFNIPPGGPVESYDLFPSHPGYKVEKVEECADGLGYAYKVTGPRTSWMLMRNKPNPSLLFVAPKLKGTARIRGYERFTDRSGKLEPAR